MQLTWQNPDPSWRDGPSVSKIWYLIRASDKSYNALVIIWFYLGFLFSRIDIFIYAFNWVSLLWKPKTFLFVLISLFIASSGVKENFIVSKYWIPVRICLSWTRRRPPWNMSCSTCTSWPRRQYKTKYKINDTISAVQWCNTSLSMTNIFLV